MIVSRSKTMIINRMRQRLDLLMPKKLIAFVLCAGLSSLSLPFASHAVQGPPQLKSESQLKSEAALYDTAIREIGRISSMKLANPDESKAAIAILKRETPNLKFIRSKLIVLGLSDSSFGSAVKAKTSDKKSAEEFAVELAKDRTAILKLNGADSVKNKVVQEVNAHTALLRKVGEQLKQAATDIRAKAKGHHAARVVPTTGLSTTPTGTPAPPIPRLTDKDVATLVIVAAMIVFPPLGIAIAVVAANAIGYLLAETTVILAVDLLLALKALAGTEKQKDAISACEDQAAHDASRCQAAAERLIPPLNFAAEDLCFGIYMLALAACLIE